jgi:hypothetical protein
LVGRCYGICAGTESGEVLLLNIHGIEPRPAILTAIGKGIARCRVCGSEFPAPQEAVAAIHAYYADIASSKVTWLNVPETAFADLRLFSQCPHCGASVKFNPFFADAAPL